MRVPCTARRSKKSILKEIRVFEYSEYSLEGLMAEALILGSHDAELTHWKIR